jgi:hypothetical protein
VDNIASSKPMAGGVYKWRVASRLQAARRRSSSAFPAGGPFGPIADVTPAAEASMILQGH